MCGSEKDARCTALMTGARATRHRRARADQVIDNDCSVAADLSREQLTRHDAEAPMLLHEGFPNFSAEHGLQALMKLIGALTTSKIRGHNCEHVITGKPNEFIGKQSRGV